MSRARKPTPIEDAVRGAVNRIDGERRAISLWCRCGKYLDGEVLDGQDPVEVARVWWADHRGDGHGPALKRC